MIVTMGLALSGCGGSDEMVDPSRSVEGVDLVVTAEVDLVGDRLTGTVEVRNEGEEVWIFDGLAVEAGAGTRYDRGAGALLDAGDGTVEIARRAVTPPDDADVTAFAVFAVARLGAGETLTSPISMSLPSEPAGPYASFGQTPPRDPSEAIVCVGAVPGDGSAQPRTGEGVPDEVEGLATHGGVWAETQAVVCTEAVPIGG